MKKALKVNLGGQIFHIDEDAYDKLKNYLDTISRHFSDSQESKEIIADIENRIAELFTDRMKDGNQVITIKDVNEIIEIMGKPEEIASDEDEGENTRSERRSHRRLYRDPDNAVAGGVCSGLGAYFNIDIVLFRILFIVLVLVGWGLPVILYLVLWIAVPKAKTAAERLEMRGEKVTVSNIEKTIREEYDSVKENLKKARGSDTFKRTEDFLTRFLRVIAVILIAFVKIILVIIAFAFIIAGIGIITGMIAFFVFGTNILHDSVGFDMFSTFFNSANMNMLAFSIMALILIPLVGLVYGLFKALFKFRAQDKALGLSAFALWFLALISAISLIFIEARNFTQSESISHTTNLTDITSRSLNVKMETSTLDREVRVKNFSIDNTRYNFLKDGNILGSPKLSINKSNSGEYEIRITKEARGKFEETASESAGIINYSYSVNNNNLLLSPYFSIPKGEKWRFQKVKATLFIPEGDTIILDKNLRNHLESTQNTGGYQSRQLADKTWVMGKEGLELVE